jgi:hypothetical protein
VGLAVQIKHLEVKVMPLGSFSDQLGLDQNLDLAASLAELAMRELVEEQELGGVPILVNGSKTFSGPSVLQELENLAS